MAWQQAARSGFRTPHGARLPAVNARRPYRLVAMAALAAASLSIAAQPQAQTRGFGSFGPPGGIKKRPSGPTGKAESLEARGNLPGAEKALRELLASKPGEKAEARAHFVLGRVLLKRQKDIPGAEAELKKSIAMSVPEPRAYLLLGMSRDLAGDARGAAAVYSNGLERFPKNLGLLQERGETRLALGNTDGAVADLRTAHKLAPKDAGVAESLGMALNQSGQAKEAIPMLRAAIAASGLRTDRTVSARLRAHLGDALAVTGDGAGAKAAYQEALTLDGSDGRTWLHLGMLQLRAGTAEEAVASIKKAESNGYKNRCHSTRPGLGTGPYGRPSGGAKSV